MAKKFTVTLGLVIATERKDGYFHITARPVTIGPADLTDYEIRSVKPDAIRNAPDHRVNGLYLHDFFVSSQGNEYEISSSTPVNNRRLYGFSYEYRDIFRLELREAKFMADTLTKIGRKLEKEYARSGNAPDFGDYVARIAKAIGATTLLFRRRDAHGSSYADNYSTVPVGEGVGRIRRLVESWQNKTNEISATSEVA